MSHAEPHIRKVKAMLDLLEQLPLPAMILHKQCVLAWNMAAQATLGWSKEEIVGEKLPASEHHERQLSNFLEWIRGAEVMVTRALTFQMKDGGELTATFMGATLNVEPLRDLTLLVMRSSEGERDAYHNMRSQLQVIQFHAELLASGMSIDPKDCGERIVAAVNKLSRLLKTAEAGAASAPHSENKPRRVVGNQ